MLELIDLATMLNDNNLFKGSKAGTFRDDNHFHFHVAAPHTPRFRAS